MLHTKALYNLLRFNVKDDPSTPHEPWAVEDLRFLSLDDLFQRLKKEAVALDRNLFMEFAETAETPEDLAEILLNEAEDPKQQDRVYLVLFELWRRLLPEKISLSLFCDELDHLIDLYDRKKLDSDELIQDALANLKNVLEENVDAGGKPRDVFAAIEEDCAHDLESFLYDYIADLLDTGNHYYASELIDSFSSFVPDPLWFKILSARLLAFTDPVEANWKMAELLKQDLDLPLLMESLRFLSKAGDKDLLVQAIEKTMPLLETEEEFQEVLQIASDFYRLLDHDDLEKSILLIIKKRKSPPERPLDPEDPDLRLFSQLIR